MHADQSNGRLALEFSCLEELERFFPARTNSLALALWTMAKGRGLVHDDALPQYLDIEINGVRVGSTLPLAAAMNADAIRSVRKTLDRMRVNGDFMMLVCCATNDCIITNDKADTDRLLLPPAEYSGLNVMQLWQHSLDTYADLNRTLHQQGEAASYVYRLKRLDGQWGEYCKDYELVQFGGDLCRLSRSLDWRLLDTATV